MTRILRTIIGLSIVLIGIGITGCERTRTSDGYTTTDTYYNSNNDYPRYVTVEVYAYTTYTIDVYIGDAYVGNIEPGRYQNFSKDLYGGEKLRLRFMVHNPNGEIRYIPLTFDDDYSNYHVNVYNDRAEYY